MIINTVVLLLSDTSIPMPHHLLTWHELRVRLTYALIGQLNLRAHPLTTGQPINDNLIICHIFGRGGGVRRVNDSNYIVVLAKCQLKWRNFSSSQA